MINIEQQLIEHKNKILEIMPCFENYYNNNYEKWDLKEITLSHQILGTLILTFKKIESMEKTIELFKEHDLMENFQIELEEVNLITHYYYETFVEKKIS